MALKSNIYNKVVEFFQSELGVDPKYIGDGYGTEWYFKKNNTYLSVIDDDTISIEGYNDNSSFYSGAIYVKSHGDFDVFIEHIKNKDNIEVNIMSNNSVKILEYDFNPADTELKQLADALNKLK